MTDLATTWTPETLAARIRRTAEVQAVGDALDAAEGLLLEALQERWRDPAQQVYDYIVYRLARAVLDSTREQYTAPASTQVEAGRPGTPPRDPMDTVRPLIRPYLVGFA